MSGAATPVQQTPPMPPTSLLPTFRERTPLLQAFQLFYDLFGLAHHVAHNLGCGFDVVHQTTRLASIEHRIVYVPCEATQRWKDHVFHHVHGRPRHGHRPNDAPPSRPLATGWAARRFPLRDRLIPDDPVGGVRPAHVEEHGIDGVFGPALHHPLLVGLDSVGLHTGEKAGAHGDGLRPETQRGHHASPGRYAARRNDRHGLDRLDHRWDHGRERGGTLHMPAGLDSLGDDDIYTRPGRGLGLLH